MTKNVIAINVRKCFELFKAKNKNLTIKEVYADSFKSGFQCGMLYQNKREMKHILSAELVREMNSRFNGSVLNDLHMCKVLSSIPVETIKAYLKEL